MTDLALYPVTAKHPPLRVRVVVQWNGRIFEASRVHHQNRDCWVRRRSDGSEQYLPPRKARSKRDREHSGWTAHPDWWRPIAPEKWHAPLPPPLPPLPAWRRHDGEERMVNIRARRRPLDAAADHAVDERAPWWMDAAAIDYQPPGEVTREMVEGRLMRALAVAGVNSLDGPRREDDRVFQSLAEARAEAEREAREREIAPLPERFMPGPADHKDWDIAMAWFAALDPPELRERWQRPWQLTDEQEILVWRAHRRSFIQIAGLLCLPHRKTAWRLYADAIDKVCRIANGLSPDGWRHPRDLMAELRARNRASRRREAAGV